MTRAPGKPGLAVSPLATPFPELKTPPDTRIGVASAGLYGRPRPDVFVLRFRRSVSAAGVFTRHAVGSAPVDWCRAALARTGGRARALVVNAGCANAFTGAVGAGAARAVAEAVSTELGCPTEEVLLASTGVIGVPLPYGKILGALPDALYGKDAGLLDAAAAMMTTDTFPKGAHASAEIFGRTVNVVGICKGSGMIAPNMATMLAFLVTDAAVEPGVLHTLLAEEVRTTLNAVTVDGDRSTNDTCLVFAVGDPSAGAVSDPRSAEGRALAAAMRQVLLSLAQNLVRDGEGARKFVEVRVTGASSDASAAKIARTICESPLVKTAIAGEDANWGRIVMAVGRADEPVDREKIRIRFGELEAARDGQVAQGYDEAAMSAYMKRDELLVSVDVGVGTGAAVMWTCDLTHGYVSINGDYRS